MSKLMLQCDSAYLGQGKWPLDFKECYYHPYFCEFIIEKKLMDNKKINKYIGKWMKMKLTLGKITEQKTLQGFLLFSASSIIRVAAELDFSDKVDLTKEEIDEINNADMADYIQCYYNDARSVEIKEKFVSSLKRITNINGKIYNVGQGNCIHMTLDDGSTSSSNLEIFFDIGESVKPSAIANEVEYITLNSQEISTSKPAFIILSHWDLDHILGITYLDADIYSNNTEKKICWIAPNLGLLPKGNQTASASRLCAYLVKAKLIWLIGDLVNKSSRKKQSIKVLDSSSNILSVKLWQGTGKTSPNGINNNIGLILNICMDVKENGVDIYNQKLLFTGDCEFRQMHKDIFCDKDQKDCKYDLLVTAHHGSKNAVFNSNLSINIPENRECKCVKGAAHARAVISYGVNTHSHPNAEHISILKRNGFSVYSTPGCQHISFSISENRRLGISTDKKTNISR